MSSHYRNFLLKGPNWDLILLSAQHLAENSTRPIIIRVDPRVVGVDFFYCISRQTVFFGLLCSTFLNQNILKGQFNDICFLDHTKVAGLLDFGCDPSAFTGGGGLGAL
jgi:hypothetical protein